MAVGWAARTCSLMMVFSAMPAMPAPLPGLKYELAGAFGPRHSSYIPSAAICATAACRLTSLAGRLLPTYGFQSLPTTWA